MPEMGEVTADPHTSVYPSVGEEEVRSAQYVLICERLGIMFRVRPRSGLIVMCMFLMIFL